VKYSRLSRVGVMLSWLLRIGLFITFSNGSMDGCSEVFAALKGRGHALLATSNWSVYIVFKWVNIRVSNLGDIDDLNSIAVASFWRILIPFAGIR
jgi:hypothetical protein